MKTAMNAPKRIKARKGPALILLLLSLTLFPGCSYLIRYGIANLSRKSSYRIALHLNKGTDPSDLDIRTLSLDEKKDSIPRTLYEDAKPFLPPKTGEGEITLELKARELILLGKSLNVLRPEDLYFDEINIYREGETTPLLTARGEVLADLFTPTNNTMVHLLRIKHR